MCNPALIVAGQGVGAGMSAIGAYGQASSQKSNLGYEARVADFNATLAERQAQIAMEKGQFTVNQLRRDTAGLKGTQRATMAARGLDLTSGTPAEVLAGTDFMGEVDANQAEINAVREAFGYRTQKTNLENEARAKRANASAIRPGMAAATSLLGSATSMASSYYGFKKAGAFGGTSGKPGSSWGSGG
jgi:hypothetical protein